MPDVTIKYGSSTIAELSDSGTKICKTKNTIVQDDIEVEYDRPTIPTNLYYTKTIPLTTNIPGNLGNITLGSATVNSNGELHIRPVGASAVNELSFAYTNPEQTLDIIIAPLLAEGHSLR